MKMSLNNAKHDVVNTGGKASTFTVGGNQITLSVNMVREYLVSGGGKVTDSEVMMFIALCKAQGLNPWVKDAYLIKYQGNQPAQIVTGIGALEKRADTFPNFDGMKSGVIAIDRQTGNIAYREGSFYLPSEEVVGGWAEVYRKDRGQPTHIEISFSEFAGRRKDGSLNSMWASKPGTMIRKVAKATALREAFPQQNSNLYIAEEVKPDVADGDAQAPEIPEQVLEQVSIPQTENIERQEPEDQEPVNERGRNPFL